LLKTPVNIPQGVYALILPTVFLFLFIDML